MKYLKLFENKKYKRKKPRIGDYVLCTDYTKIEPYEKEFIESNVGQLVSIDSKVDNPYEVYYEKVPKEYRAFHFYDHDMNINKTNCRWFNREEILHFSKDKEELEIILNAKKYNL